MQAPNQAADWTLLNHAGNDPASLQELFLRHRDYVYRLAWSLLRNQASAEDVTQDVFVRLAASKKHYVQRAAFRTWLYRVIFNSVQDHRRKQTRLIEASACPDATANDNPEACSDLERVLEALGELPERQRQVLILRLFEGFSVTETANALGCGSGSVKTHLHRATHKLRAQLLTTQDLSTTTGD